jgi:hypothetical protein
MDLCQQAVQPVRHPGRFAGQVVVEPDDHLQLGDRLVLAVDRPQRVRHRPGGVGDDERVPRVRLGLTWVEVGDPPHRQAGQVGDRAPHVPGHRQRQGPDRGRLVNDHQDGSVLGLEFREQLAELGFGVGQALVERLLAGRGDGGGVVSPLPTSRPRKTSMSPVSITCRPLHHAFGRPCQGTELPHPRYGELSRPG